MRSVYKAIAVLFVAAWLSCGGAVRKPGLHRNQATVAVAIFCDGSDVGSGSGVIVGPHTVLSAAHLVAVCPSSQFEVEMIDGKRYAVSSHRAWPEVDLALFKIDEIFPYRPITRLGGAVDVEDVICFHSGSPSRDIRCGQVESIKQYGPGNVRHSAPVEPGNSGSPVFDRYGRLIGIITHYKRCQNGQFCGGRFSSLWNRQYVFADVK